MRKTNKILLIFGFVLITLAGYTFSFNDSFGERFLSQSNNQIETTADEKA